MIQTECKPLSLYYMEGKQKRSFVAFSFGSYRHTFKIPVKSFKEYICVDVILA